MSVRDTKPNIQSSFCEETLSFQIHTKILPRVIQGRHLLKKRFVTDERGICNYEKIPDARKEKFLLFSQRQG